MSALLGIGAILLLITTIIIWPRLAFGRASGVDIYFSLLLARHIKKQGKIPRRIREYLLDKEMDYPYLLSFLLSKFNLEFISKHYWLAPAILNMITSATAYFSLNHIQNTASFFAILIALSSPMYIGENNTLTARVLGLFFFNMAAINLFFYFTENNPAFLALFVICGLLVFLSHKFSSQNFAILALLSLFSMDIFVIISVVVLALLLLSIKSYRKIFAGHINVIRYWHKERDAMLGKTKEFFSFRFISDRLLKNAAFNPLSVLVLLLPVFIYVEREWSFVESFSYIMIIAYVCIIALTTHIPLFSIFGEGWRYGAYLVVPQAIVINRFSQHIGARYLWALFSVLVALNIFMQYRINKGFKKMDCALETAQYLKKLKDKRLYPPPEFYAFFAYYTGHPILGGISSKNLAEVCDACWFFRTPIEFYIKKYKINTIIKLKGQEINDPLKKMGFVKTFENKQFVVFEN